MTDRLENPPAFPFIANDRNNIQMQTPGMTLRDYFAAAALQGIIARGSCGRDHYGATAYKHADAMLAARGSDDQ